MPLKKTDLAKRQGLQIALRMKNANKVDLLGKQAKARASTKPNALLQSILGKANHTDSKD
jgi:hypothetical protein